MTIKTQIDTIYHPRSCRTIHPLWGCPTRTKPDMVCETAHFALQNGPKRKLKRPISQCEMGRFAIY